MKTIAREAGLYKRAATFAALLGAWFFLVYGFANWITSQRDDVGVWFWQWEKHIPFIPEFVIPYYSLDLFFVGAFFLCRSRAEMANLCARLFTVILASGICFLLVPLQLGVERPMPPDGHWTLPLFKLLHAQDLPYNLAPSLHISLRSIVWITYGRHLRGWLRSGMKVWFILIGLSTLLVWQHHIMDVVTGFLMAWAVIAFLPDRETQGGPLHRWLGAVTVRHRQLALRYGIAAAIAALLAIPGHAFLLFLWPAIGLGVVSLAYATANPRFLQKSSGTLSPAAEWMLLPVMIGSSLYQRRWMKRPLLSGEITQNVWFGRKPDKRRIHDLLDKGCVAVLDLTAESNVSAHLRERVEYKNLGWLDLTHPAPDDIQQAIAFIEEHHQRGLVYIHCQLGLLRSACVAAAWLVHSGRSNTVEDAVKSVREIEPMSVFHAEAIEALKMWQQMQSAEKSA